MHTARHKAIPVMAGALALIAAAPGAGNAARGAELAASWGEYGGYACAGCHGEGLRGTASAPALAGRDAAALADKLAAYRKGTITGANAAQMQAVAQTMDDADIADLAAYAAQLPAK